jgi:hypothetical protein
MISTFKRSSTQKRLDLYTELTAAVRRARDNRIATFIDLFLHAQLSKEEAITVANKDEEVMYYSALLERVKELEK